MTSLSLPCAPRVPLAPGRSGREPAPLRKPVISEAQDAPRRGTRRMGEACGSKEGYLPASVRLQGRLGQAGYHEAPSLNKGFQSSETWGHPCGLP